VETSSVLDLVTVDDLEDRVALDDSAIQEDSAPLADSAAAPVRSRPLVAKACVMAADICAIVVGLIGAFVLTHGTNINAQGAQHALTMISLVSLPVWLVIFSRYRLYTSRFVSIRMAELGRVVHATLAGTLAMGGLAFLMKTPVPRSWLIFCFPSVLLAVCIEREAARAVFSRVRRSGKMLRRVVLVGANDEAGSIHDLTEQFPALGYQVVGIVDDHSARQLDGEPVGGRVEDTLEMVRATGASGVIVATTAVTALSSNRLVRELMDAGVHVELSSSLSDIDAERLVVRQLGPLSMLYIEPVRRGGWRAAAKRIFDIVSSLVGLILAAPILAAITVAVRLDSPGGAFFSQIRVGKDGAPFKVHKFRTMVADAEALRSALQDRNEVDGPLFKLTNDPRITRVGKWLRRFSVDEVPQLWNILKGEMSLVGPRPALYSEMEEWSPELLRTRLRVRPGLTGMWQVSGRSSLSFADYVRLDLYYVDNWSLWRDMAIVAKTVPEALKQHGAY